MRSKLINSIFSALIGTWDIERRITPGGSFSGQASFTRQSDGVLDYSEQGAFTLDNGIVLKPTKAYQWCLLDDSISIYFADGATKGQLFHHLNFIDENTANANHCCDPDTYESFYVFELPQCFSVTHTVSGPKKSYVSKSIFTAI